MWGNTDLKAIAREVGEKAPHLFKPMEAPAALGASKAVPSVPGAGLPVEDAGAVDVVRPAKDTDVDLPKQNDAAWPTAEALGRVHEGSPASHHEMKSTRTRRKAFGRAPAARIEHSPKWLREDESGRLGTVEQPNSFDELADLDSENQRLKRLLVEKLRAENLQLKKMLERLKAA